MTLGLLQPLQAQGGPRVIKSAERIGRRRSRGGLGLFPIVRGIGAVRQQPLGLKRSLGALGLGDKVIDAGIAA